MPSFHNTRWPLLTALLESKGWTRAAANTQADLSFVDDGTWQKEPDSPYPGRMRFFSRAFTDLLSNKRSFAIGLRAKGCIPEIMTSTFTDYDEWVAAVQASQGEGGGAPPLWFWKKINSANSKGISVTRTVEGGRQILMLDAAAGKDAQAKRALTTTFDDTFMGRMADALNKVLGNYVENISPSSLKLAVLSGRASLE